MTTPENSYATANDPGAGCIGHGYDGHYCTLSTSTDPSLVAGSRIVSGLRVFDIRDLANPKEVAYFDAPVQSRSNPFPPYLVASLQVPVIT